MNFITSSKTITQINDFYIKHSSKTVKQSPIIPV